jgi:hypothetical protein
MGQESLSEIFLVRLLTNCFLKEEGEEEEEDFLESRGPRSSLQEEFNSGEVSCTNRFEELGWGQLFSDCFRIAGFSCLRTQCRNASAKIM